MEEKYMVNDVLTQINGSLTNYQNTIAQCENLELRQTIQDLRNNCEKFQYDLFKLAETKGYYKPAEKANEEEIKAIKNAFN